MERTWTQDEIDDDIEPDVCHHGIGFDETCEWCELEIAEEVRVEREANKPQGDMFGHENRLLMER